MFFAKFLKYQNYIPLFVVWTSVMVIILYLIRKQNIFPFLDSRMKFVAHERFQYVLLNKFGEEDNWIINNSNILTK